MPTVQCKKLKVLREKLTRIALQSPAINGSLSCGWYKYRKKDIEVYQETLEIEHFVEVVEETAPLEQDKEATRHEEEQ